MDLDRFRRLAAGDRLRGQYQVSKQLSTDLEGNTTRAVYMFRPISTKVVPQNFVKAGITRSDRLALLDWGSRYSVKRKEKAWINMFQVLFPSFTLKHLKLQSSNRVPPLAIIPTNFVTWVFTLWKDILSRNSCIQGKSDFLAILSLLSVDLNKSSFSPLLIWRTLLIEPDFCGTLVIGLTGFHCTYH